MSVEWAGIRVSLLAATLVVTAALAGAHGAHDPDDAPAASEARAGASIYQLDGAFLDQHGRPVRLDVARGHPVLVSMFYASCRDACPLLIAAIQRIEAALPPPARAKLHVVLVTLDPINDRPAALRALAEAHGIDGRRWHLLTGSEDAARDVAAVLGIKYRRLSTGAISHSSVITLVDATGAVTERVDALGRSPARIVERLVGGQPTPQAHPSR